MPAKPLVLPLNPGDGQTFPWLSGVAARYEKFRFTSIILKYKPTCSTLTNGGVALCPIMDPNDPIPDDRHTLLNSQNTVTAPVHGWCASTFPRAAMRPTDTMYVREKHVDLLDPAERRTTDLGYYAVVVTDASLTTSEVVPITYGDLFIEYTVELSAPRAKGAGSKAAFLGGNNDAAEPEHRSIHLAGAFRAFFSALMHKTHGSRGLLNPQSTLNVELGDHTTDIYHSGGVPVEYTPLTFKEPFEGVVEIHSQSIAGMTTEDVAIIANGIDLSDHEADHNDTTWELQVGADHRHRLARVKPLRSIKNGLNKVRHTIKVVAAAGETVALALGQSTEALTHFGEMLIMDIPELLLDALPLLLI